MPSPANSPDSTNRTTGATAALLGCIFRGEFQVGDHLTETSLAEKLGISRTPVREALLEVKGLGLLELRRNRGAVFNGFSVVKLGEIYEVRSLLEVEATRKATPRIDRELLHELLQDTKRLHKARADDDDWLLDRRIHSAIAESCGNTMLAHDIDRFSALVQAIRRTVGSRVHVQAETTEQHLELLEAMTNEDAESAAEAMHRHIEAAATSAIAAIVDWQ